MADAQNLTPTQNWQSLGAGGMYGTYTTYGGGGTPRSPLDAARMGVNRTPSAEYPDGYLGTLLNRRRDDRMLDSVKTRVNQRSYQRGIHRGERVDNSSYYWPEALSPERGLKNQARGIRTTFVSELAPPPQLVNDGKTGIRSASPVPMSALRAQQFGRLRPSWK